MADEALLFGAQVFRVANFLGENGNTLIVAKLTESPSQNLDRVIAVVGHIFGEALHVTNKGALFLVKLLGDLAH